MNGAVGFWDAVGAGALVLLAVCLFVALVLLGLLGLFLLTEAFLDHIWGRRGDD